VLITGRRQQKISLHWDWLVPDISGRQVSLTPLVFITAIHDFLVSSPCRRPLDTSQFPLICVRACRNFSRDHLEKKSLWVTRSGYINLTRLAMHVWNKCPNLMDSNRFPDGGCTGELFTDVSSFTQKILNPVHACSRSGSVVWKKNRRTKNMIPSLSDRLDIYWYIKFSVS
jgi:hypothetical protein